ncbi:MAG: phosphate ABC transporter permease PstA [Bacilli bacterium]
MTKLTTEQLNSAIKRSQNMNKLTTGLFITGTILIFAIIISFIAFIVLRGTVLLDWNFMFDLPEELEVGGGVGPFFINTFYVLFISLAISIPIGVFSGIYLSEFAPKTKFTAFLSMCVESLASVPSIVIGLFGVVIFLEYFQLGWTIVGAGVALSLLNLPIITRVTEEAIQMVPRELREGSYAVGATPMQTITKIVIPAALPGIITGISLAACRALGESAVILLVGGTSASDTMWDFNMLAPGATLPVYLWYVQSDAFVPDAQEIAKKTAALLVYIVLFVSVVLRLPLFFYRSRLK